MVLNQISTRHKRINRCARETDGAGSYNSVFVALFTLQLGQGGKSGNIKVVQHGHNEPGHGSDICDTAGNNAYLLYNTSAFVSTTCVRMCQVQIVYGSAGDRQKELEFLSFQHIALRNVYVRQRCRGSFIGRSATTRIAKLSCRKEQNLKMF